MKLIRKKSSQINTAREKTAQGKSTKEPWQVLIVDDEPDVLAVTRLGLNNFRFMGRGLHFLEAESASQAHKLLAENSEIATAIIDVVMETDDAGLKLVNYIRNELGNTMIRLVIRTGQPGVAPEREVVERYDIDDYKDKTELTAQKLFTTVRTALKGYHDLCVINCNRQGLTKILDAAPTLYHPESLHEFFDGVLTQVIGLCNLGKGSCVTTVHNGAIVTTKNEKTVIQSCRGSFSHDNKERRKKLELCAQAMMRGEPAQEMPENVHLIPLEFGHEHFGLICLEYDDPLEKLDEDLVRIMVNQSASALKTINLYDDLKDAHRQAVRMLAIATEFRDKETGEHINRIQRNTIKVAMKLGLSAEVAEKYGIASILHDIGKVAIPDTILHKPERLTKEEFKIIQKHSGIGLAILKNGDWFELAQQIAYSHHERWDGGGYPVGLKGEEIPLAARIVSVVDVFDALTHKRIYKSAWTDEDAVEEIRCGAGTQFDPVVVLAFTTLWKEGALSEDQGERDE